RGACLEKIKITDADRMGPAHAAIDEGDGLRPASAESLGARRIGACDGIDAEVAELAIEMAVVGAPAEFAVGDEAQAEPLLQRNGAPDRFVFGRRQCRLINVSVGKSLALLQ